MWEIWFWFCFCSARIKLKASYMLGKCSPSPNVGNLAVYVGSSAGTYKIYVELAGVKKQAGSSF